MKLSKRTRGLLADLCGVIMILGFIYFIGTYGTDDLSLKRFILQQVGALGAIALGWIGAVALEG